MTTTHSQTFLTPTAIYSRLTVLFQTKMFENLSVLDIDKRLFPPEEQVQAERGSYFAWHLNQLIENKNITNRGLDEVATPYLVDNPFNSGILISAVELILRRKFTRATPKDASTLEEIWRMTGIGTPPERIFGFLQRIRVEERLAQEVNK